MWWGVVGCQARKTTAATWKTMKAHPENYSKWPTTPENLSNHSMCMKEIQERRISTNRRRVSRYSEEKRKTTQYFSQKENIRTVNMTSSRTQTSRLGAFVWGEGWLQPQPIVLSSNRSVHEKKPWKRSSKNKTRVFSIQMNNEDNTIFPRQKISELSTWQTFAQNNASRGALKWGEGWWSARITAKPMILSSNCNVHDKETWKTKFKE